MAGRPPVGATFEVERVGRRRSRPSLAVAAWSALLVAVVGFAVLGRGLADPQPHGVAEAPAATSAAPTDSLEALSRLVPAPGDPVFLADRINPIDLQSPAVGPVTLVTPRLLIYGHLLVRADHVEVALEARNNRVIDAVTVDMTDPNGGARPERQAQFRVEFDVPFPRPNGTMWVVVTAYDSRGLPIGGERRPFTVGPIKGT